MAENFIKIEDIILQKSGRGMELLRPYLSENYVHQAAAEILSWNRGTVFLTTGFYVAGFAETDGPCGIFCLSGALKKLGYNPIIVTDEFCRNFFEKENLQTVYVPQNAGEEYFNQLVKKYSPAGMISVERCGRNSTGDYQNMRGISIKEYTPPIDQLFSLNFKKIPTVAVGDGGNEIGMGNLFHQIEEKLSLNPSTIQVDFLVIATVSNWGAYAIAAEMQKITGQKILFDEEKLENFLQETVKIGSVDGVTKEKKLSVDGFEFSVEKKIYTELQSYAS